MISSAALHRLAAQASVRVQLQERDYVLGWFLLGLAATTHLREAMVFKGGTALRKMYFPTYRFSEDLDFTLTQPLGQDLLRTAVEDVCQLVQRLSGLRMWVALWKQTRDVEGEEAFRARLAYVGPLGRLGADPPRITLDLTRYEIIVLPAAPRAVVHPYADAPEAPGLVPTYPLEEMLAEKLRSMLCRCYSRDIFDVWHLLRYQSQRLDLERLSRSLRHKCEFKGYVYSSAEDFLVRARTPGAHAAWDASLGHLMSSAPAFDSVLAELEFLLPQWLGRDRHGG